LAPILYFKYAQTPEVAFSLNAAIIDQLGREKEFSNLTLTFKEDATTILKKYGFTVTYQNESLDVDFFRKLARYNYGIIILRVHSALREDNSTVDLFTTEEFADYKYRSELENGLLTKGVLLGKSYFVITSSFIENLEGRFPKSIVIAMGCWSLKPELQQMASAFISKGAKAYIGWTNAVLTEDTDRETLRLLRMLLNENKTLTEAVSQTKTYQYYSGSTPVTSRMDFYPPSASNLRISNLIEEAKTTSALAAASFRGLSNFLIINAMNVSTTRPKHKETTARIIETL